MNPSLEDLVKISMHIGDGYSIEELAAITSIPSSKVRKYLTYKGVDPLVVASAIAIPIMIRHMDTRALENIFNPNSEEVLDARGQAFLLNILRLCCRISFGTNLSHGQVFAIIEHFEDMLDLEFSKFRELTFDCPQEQDVLSNIGFSVVSVVFAHATGATKRNVKLLNVIRDAKCNL